MKNTSHPSVKISSSIHSVASAVTANASFAPHLMRLPKSPDRCWLTIHQQFVEYGRNAKEWIRKCQLLLPQIEKQQIWRKKRFKDIYEYAAKLAGMNYDQVNEALRVLHKAENFPSLMKVIEEKGINAVKPVITIATQTTDQFWAEKAEKMSQHTLETYVREFRNLQSVGGLRAEAAQSVNLQTVTSSHVQSFLLQVEPLQPPKITLVMQLDPQIADQLQKIKGQSDWNGIIGELLKLRQDKLDQNKPAIVAVGSGQSVATSSSGSSRSIGSRTIPVSVEKYVLAKTNSTCAFPGCYKPYDILHHVDRFTMYHTHDPDRIIPLCEAHERLAHLGLIENENQPPQYWSLRTAPDSNDPKYEVDQIVEKFRRQER